MDQLLRKALRIAQERTNAFPDASLLEALLQLEALRQYDTTPGDRLRDVEALIANWCDQHPEPSNAPE